jgi:hypothetical protein
MAQSKNTLTRNLQFYSGFTKTALEWAYQIRKRYFDNRQRQLSDMRMLGWESGTDYRRIRNEMKEHKKRLKAIQICLFFPGNRHLQACLRENH